MTTDKSKIPDYTPELEQRIANNADSLIALGVKAWKKKRRKKGQMSEVEQRETLRKMQEILDGGESG